MQDIKNVEKIIGYSFKEKNLLSLALTHKSFNNDANYERLEFLGDSIISAIVAEALYNNFPAKNEGELSKMKSIIVSADNLSSLGKDLKINDFIIMKKGEILSGLRNNKRIIGNAYEAIIGAIFLDSSYERAKNIFLDHLKKSGIFPNVLLKTSATETKGIMCKNPDYKTILQELSQKIFLTVPKYCTLKKEGPAHQAFYTVCVKIKDQIYGYGKGSTKKAAEQLAALEAINKHTRYTSQGK